MFRLLLEGLSSGRVLFFVLGALTHCYRRHSRSFTWRQSRCFSFCARRQSRHPNPFRRQLNLLLRRPFQGCLSGLRYVRCGDIFVVIILLVVMFNFLGSLCFSIIKRAGGAVFRLLLEGLSSGRVFFFVLGLKNASSTNFAVSFRSRFQCSKYTVLLRCCRGDSRQCALPPHNR